MVNGNLGKGEFILPVDGFYDNLMHLYVIVTHCMCKKWLGRLVYAAAGSTPRHPVIMHAGRLGEEGALVKASH